MALYNGLVATLIKGSSTGGENAVLTGVSSATPVSSLPAKMLKDALVAVETKGISGTYAVDLVSAIGGCTFVMAGVTGIATNGTTIIGATGTPLTIPRASYVAFSSAEDSSGFTSHVWITGEY